MPARAASSQDGSTRRPAQERAWESLRQFDKPFLCAFSDKDPVTGGADRALLRDIPGCEGQPHTTIEGAGHFLQEDKGPEFAGVIVDGLAGLAT